MKAKSLILLLVLLFPFTVHADESINQMLPLKSELLIQPIVFDGICKNVKIVEWRDSGTEESIKSFNNQNNLNMLCQYSILKFPAFVRSRGYKINSGIFTTKISLMPMNSRERNLNDIKYRFSERGVFCDLNDPCILFGYFQIADNHIYIRNDAGSDYKVVFAHEIFHAASVFYGIYYQHTGPNHIVDENMAQEFTEYLGLGR